MNAVEAVDRRKRTRTTWHGSLDFRAPASCSCHRRRLARRGPSRGADQAGELPQPSLVCDAHARGRLRHPDAAGAPGVCGSEHHDLHQVLDKEPLDSAPRSEPICPLSGLSQTQYPDGTEVCAKPFTSPVSAEDLRQQSLQALRRHNILAVTFGTDLSVVEAWRKERPDRTVPGIQTTGVDIDIRRFAGCWSPAP